MKLPQLDKLTAFLAHLSKREKLVLYCATAFITLAFFDRVIVNNAANKIKVLNQEIVNKEAQIKQDLKILAQKERIDFQRAKYSSYLESAQSENEEFTALLKEIEGLANQAGIYLIDMKPGGTKESGQSKKFLVNLNCEGKMEQITAFMYNIENSKRLLSIERYQVSPRSKDSDVAKASIVISKLAIAP